MADIKLKVIPAPSSGSVPVIKTDKKGNFTFIKGEGSDNLLCGSCGTILIEKLNRGQIQGIVFQCTNCGNYNLT
jgi:predicted RNA-binding Zn-ribbon protein involved in translation (DUF1610 family)